VFLDDTSLITVSKTAGENVAAIEALPIPAAGDGLTLSSDSTPLHAIPNVALQDHDFSCDGTDGDCGTTPDGQVSLMLIGRTTDADVTGLSQQEMPSAQSKYAVFQCLSTPGATSVTLPRAAYEIVLSTKPN